MHVEVDKRGTYTQITITDGRGDQWLINVPREQPGEIGIRLISRNNLDAMVIEPHSPTACTLKLV